jgi:hypothetical protein
MQKTSLLRLLVVVLSVALLFNLTTHPTQAAFSLPQEVTETTVIAPDAEGRGYGIVDPGFGPASVEVLEYNAPYVTYVVSYSHGYQTEVRQYLGPETNLIWDPFGSHSYDPSTIYNGPFVSQAQLPKFLLTKNSTNTPAVATYNLTIYGNVTLGFGSETTLSLTAGNIYEAIVNVTDPSELFAFTGHVSYLTSYMVIDPNLRVISSGSIIGYFAIPVMRTHNGGYAIFLHSSSDVTVSLTPTLLAPTFVASGDRISGELNLASLHQNPAGDIYFQDVPSQIITIAMPVQETDEIAYYKAIEDVGFGGGYQVFAYSSGQDGYGMPYGRDITSLMTSYQQKTVKNGTAYLVLVASTGSHIKYTLGIDSVSFPVVTIGTTFRHNTILSTTQYSYYTFSVPSESVGRFNYTLIQSGGQVFTLYRLDTTGGIIYQETGLVRSGSAQSNYQYTYHLFPGEYVLEIRTTSPSATLLQIHISTLDALTSSFTTTFNTLYAFQLPSNRFEHKTLNLTFTSQENVSVYLRLAVFSSTSALIGVDHINLGNRQINGIWQETTGWTWCYDGFYYFEGNDSLQNPSWNYLHTRPDAYWATFEVLRIYNTTPAGSFSDPWTQHDTATPQFQLVLSDAATVNKLPVQLDSTSGTGALTVPLPAFGSHNVYLTLSPQLHTWTQIRFTLINGSIIGFPAIYDAYRHGVLSFDWQNLLGLFPPPIGVINVFGFTNMTQYMEFGTLDTEMLLYIPVFCESSDSGELQIDVTHQTTTTLHGVLPPPAGLPPPAPFFIPPEQMLAVIVIFIVVVIIVAAYLLWRRRRF